jgi:hypothetical protein
VALRLPTTPTRGLAKTLSGFTPAQYSCFGGGSTCLKGFGSSPALSVRVLTTIVIYYLLLTQDHFFAKIAIRKHYLMFTVPYTPN